MSDTTKTIVESANAMDILSILNDYVWSFDWDTFSVMEETYGFCCDTGGYSHEYERDNVSEVYWTVVNYAGDSKREPNHRFTIEYVKDDFTSNPAREHPIVVGILDNDCGEYTNRYFEISRKD